MVNILSRPVLWLIIRRD